MNIKKILISTSTLFIVYSLIVFIIAGVTGHSATFWMGYIFTLISFISVNIGLYINNKKGDLFKELFWNYSIIRWSVIYLSLQFIIGIFAMIFQKLSYKVPLVIGIILLIIYIIICIASLYTKDRVQNFEKECEAQISTMKLFKTDIATCVEYAKGKEIEAAVVKLNEEFKYSDPVSNKVLEDIEFVIKEKIELLKGLIKKDDIEVTKELIGELHLLLKERNIKCRANK